MSQTEILTAEIVKELEAEDSVREQDIAAAWHRWSVLHTAKNEWLDSVRARFDFKPYDGSLFSIFSEWRRKNEHSGPCRKTGSDTLCQRCKEEENKNKS